MAHIPLVMRQHLFLVAIFRSDGLRIGLPRIEFIVDTGSPYTVLSYHDLKRLNIPERVLKDAGHLEVGGQKYRHMLFPRPAQILIKTQDGSMKAFSFSEYGAIIPTSSKEDALKSAHALSSIIGSDFLKNNRLALLYKPAAGLARLETEEGAPSYFPE